VSAGAGLLVERIEVSKVTMEEVQKLQMPIIELLARAEQERQWALCDMLSLAFQATDRAMKQALRDQHADEPIR